MKKTRTGQAKRWPVAVLATVVAAGGVYALPHMFADDSSKTQAVSTSAPTAAAGEKTIADQGTKVSSADAASIRTTDASSAAPLAVRTAAVSAAGDAEVVQPVVSVDAKTASAAASRAALIKLSFMSVQTVEYAPLEPSQKQYAKLAEIRNRAIEVSADPDAPADRVFSSSRKLEEALDRYNDTAIGNANSVKKILSEVQTATLNGRNESALNASERLLLKGVTEAQNKLTGDSTKAGALSAYKHFLLREAEANELESFKASDYTAVLNQYEANIKARIESAGSYAKDADKLQKAYHTSVKAMQAAISGSDNKNVLDAAQSGLETTYTALTEGLGLAEEIRKAQPLLDSPVGREVGKYPASAIGTLNRAINKAQRALDTAKTSAGIAEARAELVKSISDFKAKRNA
ncbi:hypothetical protein [Saccharibacillus kuerlensis]|uniref:Uncharacterized protein n=1 Tax=Saccharibacillus kuerlensis TaxID=459527 RepID=A0ABQ2KXH8_9BACL|nr:hypothetical protein [Saccharibacillus kuerlensis]GGN95768.1 hypothetical protein GCM10010969_11970 [Saccharibacillus kuerlensis]